MKNRIRLLVTLCLFGLSGQLASMEENGVNKERDEFLAKIFSKMVLIVECRKETSELDLSNNKLNELTLECYQKIGNMTHLRSLDLSGDNLDRLLPLEYWKKVATEEGLRGLFNDNNGNKEEIVLSTESVQALSDTERTRPQ